MAIDSKASSHWKCKAERRSCGRSGVVWSIGLLLAIIAPARQGFAQTAAPPSGLVSLEKKVSLKIAHVRIKGPTNAAEIKQLTQAEQIAALGEKAMAAGDYRGAEQDFLRANVIISVIGK
jgi:hypothetical protein